MRRERRLVNRVLRLWKELAPEATFPRRDQFEPSMLGEDWANCIVIAVEALKFCRGREELFPPVVAQQHLGRHSFVTSAAGRLGAPLPDDRGSRNPRRVGTARRGAF
jgi:hypothetical protein